MRLPKGDTGAYQYDTRDAAYVKAELIRRNLLSRKDLMQLYRPPMKKSQIPENNPFIAKSMVNRNINSAIIRVSSNPNAAVGNQNMSQSMSKMPQINSGASPFVSNAAKLRKSTNNLDAAVRQSYSSAQYQKASLNQSNMS